MLACAVTLKFHGIRPFTRVPREPLPLAENTQEQSRMPGKGRPFLKGVSGNPGGRPKVLGDVQELARQKSPEAIITLANVMHDEKAPPAARVAAANALL